MKIKITVDFQMFTTTNPTTFTEEFTFDTQVDLRKFNQWFTGPFTIDEEWLTNITHTTNQSNAALDNQYLALRDMAYYKNKNSKVFESTPIKHKAVVLENEDRYKL